MPLVTLPRLLIFSEFRQTLYSPASFRADRSLDVILSERDILDSCFPSTSAVVTRNLRRGYGGASQARAAKD